MDEIYVGETLDRERIAIPNALRTGHVQIVGATGRGKTESVILPWLLQDVIHARPTVLIDGKGDRKFLEKVQAAIRREGLAEETLAWVDLGRLDTSFVTNPLLYGSSQQITDRLFSIFNFESEYFRNVSYEAALFFVKCLIAAGEVVTFRGLSELFTEADRLPKLLSKAPKDEALLKGAARFLKLSEKDRTERFSGLVAQLSPFAEGEIAALVNASGNEKNFFSLTELVSPEINKEERPRRTVLLLLPQLLYQGTAARLGKMLLQEVAWAVGHREASAYRDFTAVFLDEFGSFVYEGFIGLLNKARSTNTAIHLSHQSQGDTEAVSQEFATALHTNTNVKCVLGVNDPKTADFFAKHFGTRKTEKKTERARKRGYFAAEERTGEMSMRDVKEYRVDPDHLRNYSQGRGVLSLIVDGYALAEEVQFSRAPL